MGQDTLLLLMLQHRKQEFCISEFCRLTGLSRGTVGRNCESLRKQAKIYNINITRGKRGKFIYCIN